METEAIKAEFFNHLRKVLNCLYDPAVLRSSPLIPWLRVKSPQRAASALRNILTNAIESLRPQKNTPLDSRTWRVYQILRRRYTEQLTQQQVAADLGLSVRQLQREEKLAREVLGEYLWAAYNLEERADVLESTPQTHVSPTKIPTRDQELEWLKNSVTEKMTNVIKVIQEVLDTLKPLLYTAAMEVTKILPDEVPPVLLKAPLLRQALLNLINVAIQRLNHGTIQLHLQPSPDQIAIQIKAWGSTTGACTKDVSHIETLNMAEQLIKLCKGHIDITWTFNDETNLTAIVTLPVEAQLPVLVIDDNVDVLQLFERYLSDTRYQFIGAHDTQQGLKLAETVHPKIIVLDVMMPGKDGWTLLGQLREHPKIQNVPIIVCTILSQADLAMVLGAADFLRKPVKQAEFLSALDHQLE